MWLTRKPKGTISQMKAIVFTENGSADVLHMRDVADPVAGPGEVVVDIRAASVNGADYKVRQGGGPYKMRFPHILGRDFSGIVSSVGPGVVDLANGDAVFGVLDQGIEGTYAEKLVVKADIIAIKPDWLSHVHAAAVALIGITAIWAIEDTARLVNGEVILIQGGAGGVGGFAVQLARHLGARVITTASANNYAYVKSLGADQVIDYNAQDFTECVAPCDVVFDTVGGDIQSRSYQVLKPGGRLIWIAPGPQGLEAPRHDVRAERPAVFRDRRHLQRILELLKAGSVAPPPIQQFKLSEAGAAHRISEGRHLRGKLVLQP
jgi:NADPH:quinone reductase-like Zn-dependent oxidoreductase